LVFAIVSCALAADTNAVQFIDIPSATTTRKTTSAGAGTVQFIDVPKSGAASSTDGLRKASKKASAGTADAGAVQFIDIPKASEGAATTASAPAAATTTSTKPEKAEGVSFLNVLKPLSNLFGSGDTTTTTSVPKQAAAVQFLDPATTSTNTKSSTDVATKPAAGTVQMLDVTPAATVETTTTLTPTAKSSIGGASAKPIQYVDMTTSDANTIVGASAATKKNYLRKSDAAALNAADSASGSATTASPKYSKSFATGAYSDVTEVLQKKILQTSKALDSSETLEGSLKLADLLVKLSEALNNLAGK